MHEVGTSSVSSVQGRGTVLKDYFRKSPSRFGGLGGNPKEVKMEGRGGAGQMIHARKIRKRNIKAMKKIKKLNPEAHKKMKQKIKDWKKWEKGWSGIF